MKERIKVDHSILALVIILTGILYQFPNVYCVTEGSDNILDLFGFILILMGTYFRMAARGHKKAHSQEGNGLVTTGLYKYIRNPMYLGTLLMGMGYVLVVWPWWSLPVFTVLFYLRFKPQMVKEEGHLKSLFDPSYSLYFNEVPRLFPTYQSLKKLSVKETFRWEETWSTQENRGLIMWPLLAILLETIQQRLLFGSINIAQTLMIFVAASMIFAIGVWYRYQKNGHHSE